MEYMLTTADVAARLGITTAGVRYLVRKGKIRPDMRTSAGYPLFTDATIEQAERERGREAGSVKQARERRERIIPPSPAL